VFSRLSIPSSAHILPSRTHSSSQTCKARSGQREDSHAPIQTLDRDLSSVVVTRKRDLAVLFRIRQPKHRNHHSQDTCHCPPSAPRASHSSVSSSISHRWTPRHSLQLGGEGFICACCGSGGAPAQVAMRCCQLAIDLERSCRDAFKVIFSGNSHCDLDEAGSRATLMLKVAPLFPSQKLR
jgi:hypothetical protein